MSTNRQLKNEKCRVDSQSLQGRDTTGRENAVPAAEHASGWYPGRHMAWIHRTRRRSHIALSPTRLQDDRCESCGAGYCPSLSETNRWDTPGCRSPKIRWTTQLMVVSPQDESTGPGECRYLELRHAHGSNKNQITVRLPLTCRSVQVSNDGSVQVQSPRSRHVVMRYCQPSG